MEHGAAAVVGVVEEPGEDEEVDDVDAVAANAFVGAGSFVEMSEETEEGQADDFHGFFSWPLNWCSMMHLYPQQHFLH